MWEEEREWLRPVLWLPRNAVADTMVDEWRPLPERPLGFGTNATQMQNLEQENSR